MIWNKLSYFIYGDWLFFNGLGFVPSCLVYYPKKKINNISVIIFIYHFIYQYYVTDYDYLLDFIILSMNNILSCH